MLDNIISLKKSLTEISFVEREKVNGIYKKNKCGRDALYYVLNYFDSETFSKDKKNPEFLEKNNILGRSVPAAFAFTQIQFSQVSSVLQNSKMKLFINKKPINGYWSFVRAVLFSRLSYQEGIRILENNIKKDLPVILDIAIGWGGLLDHAMFVYGFDDVYIYTCDTRKLQTLEHENFSEVKGLFRIKREDVKKRWTRFGRIWSFEKIN